eukprot:scaffold1351_cov176-Amphora_coffeaeformis.AAC.20
MLSNVARLVSRRAVVVSSAMRPAIALGARGFHATSMMMDLPYHIVVGMPSLSPTMESGSLAEWYVAEGDSISAGDGIAKIETDKASMDFEAQDDAFIAKLLRTPADGNDLPVGTPIMITVEDADDVAAFKDYVYTAAEAPTPPPAAAAPEPVKEAAPPPKPAKSEPAAAAPSPPPAAASAPTPASAPPAGDGQSITIAWARPISKASPLTKSMTKQQDEYMKLYGSTGQRKVTVEE